jgi:hypothetical protein
MERLNNLTEAKSKGYNHFEASSTNSIQPENKYIIHCTCIYITVTNGSFPTI